MPKNDYILDERDDPTIKYDFFLFNMIHANSGSIGLILATINISLGVFYAVLEWYWLVIWFSFLGICVLLYGFLEVVNFLNYSDQVAKDTKMSEFDTTSNYSNISLGSSVNKMKESNFSNNPQASRYMRPQEKQMTEKQLMNASVPSTANSVNSRHSFAKVNNISHTNLQKLNKYQNSRENLVNTINLKYYL